MIFVSFDNARKKENEGGLAELISKDSLIFLDTARKIGLVKDKLEEEARMGQYDGKLGLVMTQQWQVLEFLEGNYFEDYVDFITPPPSGKCYFFSYEDVLDMKDLTLIEGTVDGYLVSSDDVTFYDISSPASIGTTVKNSLKKTRFDTPADSSSGRGRSSMNSEGMTTGGSNSSDDSYEINTAAVEKTMKPLKKQPEVKVAAQPQQKRQTDVEIKEEGIKNTRHIETISTSQDVDIVFPRTEGPSYRENAKLDMITNSGKKRASRGEQNNVDKDYERERLRAFNDAWRGMKSASDWRLEWGSESLIDNDFYMTPLSAALNIEKSIENLEYFHTKDAIMAHVEANPVLSLGWKDLWPILNSHGWEISPLTKTGKPGGYQSIPSSSKEKLKYGVHKFSSKLAVSKFISRFPFPLQDDAVFIGTLEQQGMYRISQANSEDPVKFSVDGQNNSRRGYSLSEIRTFLWEKPSLLFSANSTISSDIIMSAIALEVKVAKSEENEPDTPSPKKKSSASTSKKSLNTPGRSTSVADFIAHTNVLDTEDDKSTLTKLLAHDGWKKFPATWTNDWWRLEMVTLAPFYNPPKPVTLGLYGFFDIVDIFRFLKKNSNSKGNLNSLKSLKSIDLKVDYRKPDWSLNRRIKEIASLRTFNPKDNQLYEMLILSGWNRFTPRNDVLQTNTHDGNIYVPHWNADKVFPGSIHEYYVNQDYFCHTDSMLSHLIENGNYPGEVSRSASSGNSIASRRSRGASSGNSIASSSSACSSKDFSKLKKREIISSPVDTNVSYVSDYDLGSPPEMADDQLMYWLAEDSRLSKSNDTQKVNWDKIWAPLKKMGWSNRYAEGKIAVFVPSWSMDQIKENNTIDVKDLESGRDYFEDNASIIKYLKKYGYTRAPGNGTPQDTSLGRKRRSSSNDDEEVQEADETAVEEYLAHQHAAKKQKRYSEAIPTPFLPSPPTRIKEFTEEDLTNDKNSLTTAELAIFGFEDHDESEDEEDEQEEDEDEDKEDEEVAEKERKMLEDEESLMKAAPDVDPSFDLDFGGMVHDLNENMITDLYNAHDLKASLIARKRMWSADNGIGKLCHRIEKYKSKYAVSNILLAPYKINVDYFHNDEMFVEYVHGQFRARGINVVILSKKVRDHEKLEELNAFDSAKKIKDSTLTMSSNLHLLPEDSTLSENNTLEEYHSNNSNVVESPVVAKQSIFQSAFSAVKSVLGSQ